MGASIEEGGGRGGGLEDMPSGPSPLPKKLTRGLAVFPTRPDRTCDELQSRGEC